MKRKHVITTLALSMLLGVGVFAGITANRVREAKADGESTLYCKMAYDWWKADGAAIGVHYWGGDTSTDYPGVRGTKVTSDTDVWKFEVPSNSTGLIFTRVSGTGAVSDYGAKTADLTIPTDGKNLYTISSSSPVWGDPGVDGSWSAYVEPTPAVTYDVHVVVDGVDTGVQHIDEGNLPADPTMAYGQVFSGWFDDAACTKGHEVEEITSNTTVYGKVTNAEKVTFALDTSKVSTVFTGTLNLYAWDNNGKNADWPGVEIADVNAIELPNTVKAVINNGTVQTVDVTTLKNNDTLRILNDVDEMNHYKVQWQSDVDEPAEEGYYIVGTESEWKFEGATKMDAGDDLDLAKLIGYEAKAHEEFKVRGYHNGEKTWYNLPDTTDNYVVGDEDKVLDIFVNQYGTVYVFEEPEPDTDFPAEEGYYIVGTESEWKFAGATKMDAGEDGNRAQKLQYAAKANEEFLVRSYIDGVKTWHHLPDSDENYEVGDEAKVLNIYVNGEGKLYVSEYVEPDVPTQGNGYYIVGTETEWKYAGATKMPEVATYGNDAELLNYAGKAGEKLKVRYYNEQEAKDVYGFCKSGAIEGVGAPDEKENFVFEAAANVDIFAKWEEVSEDNWQINFYVTAHADRYEVTIHDVLFEGAKKVGLAAETHTARATAGVDFEYNLPDMNGYVARALYTDENCTTLYEKHALTGNTDLYAKYTRLGYYMTGDSTYTGSTDTAWQIDGASYLTSDVNDPLNRLEGTVVIPASADEENPVVVKALQFTGIDEEGKTIWAATTYELGATYTFVELDKYSNFVFKKGGTFAVYINQENKVYFNEGAAAFYTKFITDMNHVCDANGHTNLEALGAAWAELKVAYDSLSADEKAAVVAVGIDGGNPEGDDLHKVVASYEYIVKKYGTNVCEDFIWNGSYTPNANYGTIGVTADDSVMTIVVIASISVISAAGLFFLIRRKRRLVK